MEGLLSMVTSSAKGAWDQHSGLDGDLQKLRSTLPTVEILIDKADRWRFQNPNVAKLLTGLKDVKYDAEDLLDEFHYEELKQKVEGKKESGHISQLLSKVSYFTRHMISCKPSTVKEIQGRLNDAAANLKQANELLDTNDYPKQSGKSVRRETSSLPFDRKPFGRVEEKDKVVKLLLESSDGVGSFNDNGDGSVASCSKRRKKENVSVLPIVGMGGVGKTTLAQMVYDNQKVREHFQLRIWVCVSDFFNVTRLTKELIESANTERQLNTTNLNSLQTILREEVRSKKFVLVLDDVWNEDVQEWQSLCAPLTHGPKGSMILVTTRYPMVAKITGTMDPFFLEGLPENIYLDFFNECAFGTKNPLNHRELQNIAKEIATRLKGSPLAAKTLGGLLNTNFDVRCWRTIANSEIWRLPQGESGILPALRLSYQYLPAHLKPCFSFCSLFPKDHCFSKDNLIEMWVAEGFIAPQGDELLEDIGSVYFENLINRSFLQVADWGYVIHDLMHDVAQSILADECFCVQTSECRQNLLPTLRHLSVCTNEFDLKLLGGYNKLHTLVFLQTHTFDLNSIHLNSSTNFLITEHTKLHMLDLSGCQIKELPECIGNLKHLRYLNISRNRMASLPESIGQLYNLQYLRAWGNPLESIPKDFNNLISLRKLDESRKIIPMIFGVGKLTSFQNMEEFIVQKKEGYKIGELKNMTLLSGYLDIRNLENVEGKEDAARAALTNKKYLDQLGLYWSDGRSDDYVLDEEVLEGLQPHSNLKKLTIGSYCGGKFSSWLQLLPSSLTSITIGSCHNLTSLTSCLLPQQLPRLEGLHLYDCEKLISLPTDSLDGFVFLKVLSINNCPKITCPGKLVLPPSIERLSLGSCGDLELLLPESLQNLTSLTALEIHDFPYTTSLAGHALCHLTALEALSIWNCKELTCLGGLPDPLSLRWLSVVGCPRLTELELLVCENEEKGKRESRLEAVTISNTSFLKPFLTNPLTSLRNLRIKESTEASMFTGEDKELLLSLKSLEYLGFYDCPNLQSLPDELHMLTSLHQLDVCDCPEIKSLPEKGLPASMYAYGVNRCDPMFEEKFKKHIRERTTET